jgi:hypothetical protein
MSQHAALPRQELQVLFDLHEVGCAKALRMFFYGNPHRTKSEKTLSLFNYFLASNQVIYCTHHERPFWFFVHACVHVEKMTAAEA